MFGQLAKPRKESTLLIGINRGVTPAVTTVWCTELGATLLNGLCSTTEYSAYFRCPNVSSFSPHRRLAKGSSTFGPGLPGRDASEESRTTDSLRPGGRGEFLARWCRACAACALLSRNIEPKRLAVTSDRQRFAAFEVTRQVLAELTHANLFGFHSAYSVYTITYFGMSRPAKKPANWLQKEKQA